MTSSCTDDIRDDNKAAQMTGSPDPYSNNRVVLPRQHQFPGSESKKALKTGFM
jgi:hypothetical protein